MITSQPTVELTPAVSKYGQELIDMIKAKYPQAHFIGPYYWPVESIWLIEAYFDTAEDFELSENLADRGTNISLETGIFLGTLCMPMEAWQHRN
jgi:hypothetical protein